MNRHHLYTEIIMICLCLSWSAVLPGNGLAQTCFSTNCQGMVLSYCMPTNSFHPGDPIPLVLAATNNSLAMVKTSYPPRMDSFKIIVRDSDGKIAPATSWSSKILRGIVSAGTGSLPPLEAGKGFSLQSVLNSEFDMTIPGQYTVEISKAFRLLGDNNASGVLVHLKPLHILVVSPEIDSDVASPDKGQDMSEGTDAPLDMGDPAVLMQTNDVGVVLYCSLATNVYTTFEVAGLTLGFMNNSDGVVQTVPDVLSNVFRINIMDEAGVPCTMTALGRSLHAAYSTDKEHRLPLRLKERESVATTMRISSLFDMTVAKTYVISVSVNFDRTRNGTVERASICLPKIAVRVADPAPLGVGTTY